MDKEKYAIGIDFGTESGRSVLVNIADGSEAAASVYEYPHGVMDKELPDGTQLEPDWALQHPEDYLGVIEHTIPDIIRKAGIASRQVVGIGIDFTACTMLPMKKDGTPLCLIDEYSCNPHAWVKLWKHHAAQPEADLVNKTARKRNEPWLEYYGSKISSEWFIPKALQILLEAPDIYHEADSFIEAADWVILQLTGEEKRNSCTAGYKAIWDADAGYPSSDYFKELHPDFENIIQEKLSEDIYPLGTKAGELTGEMAEKTGLVKGTPVAVANVDAHASVPAATIISPGKMLMIMGTSICHMVLGEEKKAVEGQCGVVKDGIITGFYGYEAGQSGGGDILAWFVNNGVPETYEAQARNKGIDIHMLLEEKASRLLPGESGLLALDWLNGNRSVLVDMNLTGMLIGLTISTTPEEIYRALIESLAFGTLKIISNFEEQGIRINELYACGGLPEKNNLLMQIFSDVTGRTIHAARSSQAAAVGSAMFGACAAGPQERGYASIEEAVSHMAGLKDKKWSPDESNTAVYAELFREYETLHDHFGRGTNDVMKRLKALAIQQKIS